MFKRFLPSEWYYSTWKEKKSRTFLRFFYTLRSFERELVILLDYEMISFFLKHPVHLKWCQIVWNTLYSIDHLI